MKLFKKHILPVFFAMLLLCSLLPGIALPTLAATGDRYVITAWNYGAGSGTNSMPSNAGEAVWSGNVQLAIGTFGSTKGSIQANSWSNAAQSLTFSFTTKGFSDILHSGQTTSSNTGPKNFKVQYSLNGTDYTDCGTFVVPGTSLGDAPVNVALPAACDNQELVYVRWVLKDTESLNGGTIGSGGTFNFTAANFTGIALDESLTPELVGGTEIPLGEPVFLSTDTADASIFYKAYPSEAAYSTYNPSAGIVLNSLPASIIAYASKDGTDGRARVFDFTQLKVKAVTASRYSGGLEAERNIILSCDTPNATIYYTVTTQYGLAGQQTEAEAVYSAPFSFAEAQFPVHVEARAVRSGCLNSELLVLDYTLKASGGEQFYYGILHTHTNLSDGAGTIYEAYDYAKNTAKNVDFAIVTDHSNSLDSKDNLGTMDGANLGTDYSGGKTKWEVAKEAAAAAADESFVAGYGYEMTWTGGTYGHINTYNTPGFVSRNDAQYVISGGQGLRNYYDLLTQFPASLSQFNHPGDTFGDFVDFAYYTEEYDAMFQLVEVGNGEGAVRGSMYWPSYEYYIRALDKGWHLAPSNNQDNHAGKWGDSNTCRTVVYTNDFTEQGIYAAIRDLRVIATEDDNASVLMLVNGELFGTRFETPQSNLHFAVTITDPDAGDVSGKLSILGNGGAVAYSQSYVLSGGSVTLEFDLSPEYDYYLARVDQSDKDIVITSPVWLSDVQKVSVSGMESAAGGTSIISGEQTEILVSVENNEGLPYAVSAAELYYLDRDGETPIVLDTATAATVYAGASHSFTFSVTHHDLGNLTLFASFTGTLGGEALNISGRQKFTVYRESDILRVAVDAGHDNYYVSGVYPDMLKQLGNLVQTYDGICSTLSYPITDAQLAGVDLVVLTVPWITSGSSNGPGRAYDNAEIEALNRYAETGGSILIAGKSGSTGNPLMNAVLTGLGTSTQLATNSLTDETNNTGNNYAMHYTTNDIFVMESDTAAGIRDTDNDFVYYSGSGVVAGAGASVVAHGSTTTAPGGTAAAMLTEETLSGGGKLYVTGCVFFNDYQVTGVEYTEGQTANYHLIDNIVRNCMPTTSLEEVRTKAPGEFYRVKGRLISNAGEYSANTAFFDAAYMEDEMGGICLFPVSGNYHAGQQVWASGFVDAYQGDFELSEVTLRIQNNVDQSVTAHAVTALQAAAAENQGKLLSVSGTVVDVTMKSGRPEYIWVEDETGIAVVFLDGYIESDGPYDLSGIVIGASITAWGVATTGPVAGEVEYTPRLRVRDAAEIRVQTDAIWGDANCSGNVNASDAAAILRYLAGLGTLSAQGIENANVDGGSLTASDAATILRYLVGLYTP